MKNKRYNKEGEEVEMPNVKNYRGKDTRNVDYEQDCIKYDQAKTIKQWIELSQERGKEIEEFKEIHILCENLSRERLQKVDELKEFIDVIYKSVIGGGELVSFQKHHIDKMFELLKQ